MSGRSQPKRSLILDAVDPRDYRELTIIHACEQCSHFAPAQRACTLGFPAENHVAERQRYTYELYGKIAFCRFTEID